jgi:N-acyl-D-aspartate/D-glutamate deacylase
MFPSSPTYVAEVNSHPRVLPGTSDGGAHVKFWSGGQYGSDLISWLVREEGVMTLEEMHHKLSAVPAEALDWHDRGTIAEGKAADIMIYDFEEIGHLGHYDTVYDFPGGDWRRVARAKGINYVLVNGQVTFVNNECTGATPGQIISTTGALTNA